MKYHYYQPNEKGFILLATMIILILLSIIGLSMYQQIVLSTKSIGTSRLKYLAQAASLDTLNTIENNNIKANKDLPTTVCADKAACAPPTAAVIDHIIMGGASTDFTKMGGTSTGTDIYYSIQNLGTNSQFAGRTLYRTTIITNVMGTADVIESVYAAVTP